MNEKDRPIGVFDSGVGGISVLRELVRLMPNENYIYFGDSQNAPYGTKELEQVQSLTIENVNYLLEQGAKAIAVACNTATSAAVAILRRRYPDLPLVGIEPAIKPAVLENPNSQIVVMATPMTLRNEKFKTLMQKYQGEAAIMPLPCPGLMEYVEKGNLRGKDLEKYLTELFWSVDSEEISAIVLGCTHYPFARNMIQKVVGDEIKIYDGGMGTAKEMQRRLTDAKMTTDSMQKGTVRFINSKDTQSKLALCEKLLHLPYMD